MPKRRVGIIGRTMESIVARPAVATLTVGGSILAMLQGIDQLALVWSELRYLRLVVPFVPPFLVTRTARRIKENELAALLAEERAIQRLRAEVLSMDGMEDLLKVIVLMFEEIRTLGMETSACGIFFVEEEAERIIWYSAMVNPKKYGISWTFAGLVEIDENVAAMKLETPIDPSWEEDLRLWKAGKTWSAERTEEEDAAELQGLLDICGFERPPPVMGPDWLVTCVPFESGWVAFRHRKLDAQQLVTPEKLTQALALGYVRYVDLQRLEASES